MKQPTPPPKPGPLRSWLKLALRSGALERIPRHFPDGAHGPVDTIDYARELLESLNEAAANPGSMPEVALAAAQFRDWVESRQQISRRIILAESRPGEGIERAPERPPTSPGGRMPRSVRPSSPSPRSDPMWDDFLDGQGM
jgi:hypothetical protein